MQNKKQRDTAIQDKEMAIKKAAREKAEGNATSDKENTVETTNVLGDEEDEDVIF